MPLMPPMPRMRPLPPLPLLPLYPSASLFLCQSPTPTPTAQRAEETSRARVDGFATFRAPQHAARYRIVVFPEVEIRMQANRRVILNLRHLFGHDTEYRPKIRAGQVQFQNCRITTFGQRPCALRAWR
jgi:hypothetical protein